MSTTRGLRGFFVFRGNAEVIAPLSDAEAGEVFKACFTLVETGEKPELTTPAANIALAALAKDFEQSALRYREVSRARREAGRRGGLATQAKIKQNASKTQAKIKQNSEIQANQAIAPTQNQANQALKLELNQEYSTKKSEVANDANLDSLLPGFSDVPVNSVLRPKKTRSPNPADHRKWPIEVFRDKARETAKGIPGFTDDDLERFTLHWTKMVQPSNKPLYAMTRAFSLENNLRQWQKNKPEWLKNQDQSSGQPSGQSPLDPRMPPKAY